MIEMTLGEVATIVGGRLVDADPAAMVTGRIEYDSRRVGPGGLFLALPGEHVDGHLFAGAAIERGALAVIASQPVAGPRIEVADGIDAITALAATVAGRLSATVVGITGSSGKTSTKDLLGAVLATLGPTIAPANSANNELGHPYTVLRADAATRFLVLELGARGIGHIRHLTEIAPLQSGIVLNVGSAHIGEFGSRAAIAQAKGELVEALPADGLAVLNADDPLVMGMAARTAARVVTFGMSADADVWADEVTTDELQRPGFVLHSGAESAAVQLRFVGVHSVSNAIASAALALNYGLSVPETAAALSAAPPASHWRMELTERPDGVVVINDAYNSNPESIRAALSTLVSVTAARSGRSVAVLGHMAELGATEHHEHEAVGRLVAQLGIARLLVVGEPARPILDAAILEGSGTAATRTSADWVPDAETATAALRAELRPGDVVLVKASRAASLERVALAIAEDEPGE